MDWNQLTALPAVLGAVQEPALHAARRPAGAGAAGARHRPTRCSSAGWAASTSPSSPRRIAPILSILIIGQQGYTGGVNGITDLKTLLGWDIRTDSAKLILYYVNAGLLLGAICRAAAC